MLPCHHLGDQLQNRSRNLSNRHQDALQMFLFFFSLINYPSVHSSSDESKILRFWNYKVDGGFFPLLWYIRETFTELFVTESLLVTLSKLLSSNIVNAIISRFASTILSGFVPQKRPVMRRPETEQYIWVVWVNRVLCSCSYGEARLCCLTTEEQRWK